MMSTNNTSLQNIAVLITCYNRKENTYACLESLYKADLPENFRITVYLVDDNSSDGTIQMIEENYPAVKIIQGNGQLYWNRGMRLAWEMAAKENFDFYLWLNNDTYVFDSALQDLLNAIKVKGTNTIVCGVTKSNLTNTITYGGFKNGKLLIPNGNLQPCDAFNGNLVLVPQEVYMKIGNLDNTFSHSIGDLDYGLRAKKKGVNLIITDVSIAWCETNSRLPLCWDAEISLPKRFKYLYSPLGYANPSEFFIFEKRHYGILKAIYHFISIHLRLLFPKLW